MENYSRKEKLRVSVLNVTEESEHFHQDIELLYILEGSMIVTMSDQVTRMKQDDILVINGNRKHHLQASDDILFMKLFIEYELVIDVFNSLDVIFWCDSTRDESERFDELRKIMKQLLNHYLSTKDGVKNFGHIARCYQIMDILSVHFLVQSADKENMNDKDKSEYRLLQINNYIRSNYNQPISIKDLSQQLFLSNGYLSRLFKKKYGMSFAEYLTNIRLYRAVDELLYTNKPITRIAYDNGFTSIAIFNRVFKKAYDKTPSALRENSKKQIIEKEKDKNSSFIQERLKQFLRYDGVESVDETGSDSIVAEYSVKCKKELTPFWNKMINVGEAAELLRFEVREHIVFLKEVLKFEYVRIWNIFSAQLLIDVTRKEEDFNFTRMDSIFDFLVEKELKLHIELGQKPKRINRNVQNYIEFKNSEVVFEDCKQWDRVIEALFRHWVNRYGHKEVDKWKIELWYNEQQPDSEEKVNDYFELFNHTYEIIRKYSSSIEVGGCGIQTEYTIHLKQEFLRKWMEQKYKPDFISVMNFAYVRGKENLDIYSKRSTDNACLLHGIQSVKADLTAAGIRNIKIYATEWNLSISDRNYINDTCFKGAYILKNILDVYGEVDGLGYFLGSDHISEHFDSNALLHGGLGLLSKDGIIKPAGFAYEFLNRLFPYFIGKGENYLITADHHDKYGIICHNMRNLNYNYYFIKEDEIEKEHIWKYFEDRDSLVMKFKLTDMENGLYQCKSYRINEQYGSVINIWEEMDFDKELSRNDIEYFRRVCEPKLSIQKYEVKNNTAEIELQMMPNEIAFIKINKIE